MTVKELIEKLKEFEEDREVLAYTQDWAYYEVKKIESNDRTLEDWTKLFEVLIS